MSTRSTITVTLLNRKVENISELNFLVLQEEMQLYTFTHQHLSNIEGEQFLVITISEKKCKSVTYIQKNLTSKCISPNNLKYIH